MRDFLLPRPERGVNGGPYPMPASKDYSWGLLTRIKQEVAEQYGVTVAELEGPRRTARIATARQEAYRRLIETGKYSTPQIGRQFGNRDHTTVIYGARKAKERLSA